MIPEKYIPIMVGLIFQVSLWSWYAMAIRRNNMVYKFVITIIEREGWQETKRMPSYQSICKSPVKFRYGKMKAHVKGGEKWW